MTSKSLVSVFLIGWAVLLAPAVLACEKHLDGHRNGSESQAEAQRR